MKCPVRRIYSLVKRRTGFRVWRIYAWRGFLGCPQPRPLHVIWNFTRLPTKLPLGWTVARRVFIPCHGKLKLTLRRALKYAAACLWWQSFTTKCVDGSEIWFELVFHSFHCSNTSLSVAPTKTLQVFQYFAQRLNFHVSGMFWTSVMLVLMHFGTPFITFATKWCTAI